MLPEPVIKPVGKEAFNNRDTNPILNQEPQPVINQDIESVVNQEPGAALNQAPDHVVIQEEELNFDQVTLLRRSRHSYSIKEKWDLVQADRNLVTNGGLVC